MIQRLSNFFFIINWYFIIFYSLSFFKIRKNNDSSNDNWINFRWFNLSASTQEIKWPNNLSFARNSGQNKYPYHSSEWSFWKHIAPSYYGNKITKLSIFHNNLLFVWPVCFPFIFLFWIAHLSNLFFVFISNRSRLFIFY